MLGEEKEQGGEGISGQQSARWCLFRRLAELLKQRPFEAAVLISFGLSLLALSALCLGFAFNCPRRYIVGALITSLFFSLFFWIVSILCAQINDKDVVCWEALHQSLMAWRQAAREQSDNKRVQSLYEQGKGSLSLAREIGLTCQELQKIMNKLEECCKSRDVGSCVSYGLGVLHALNPFVVPSVRLAVWVQTLWQVWMVIASLLGAFITWRVLTNSPLRALIYAASGGILGASLYNLRTLEDHIAVQRNYSTRFWVDYSTRPLLGGVLGLVVYVFAVGLAWTLTPQSTAGGITSKVAFALGFLSGYALRTVLTWLSDIAKTIFRPAPSPSQEQPSPPPASSPS